MKCKEFWQQIEGLSDITPLPEELQRHIEICDTCNRQWQVLATGLKELKKEICCQEDPLFWANMKANIRKKIDKPKAWRSFFKQWRFWSFATATLAIALVIFGLFCTKDVVPTKQDIVEMFTGPPYLNIYDENDAIRGNSPANELEDPCIFAELTDSWASVLDDALTNTGGKS